MSISPPSTSRWNKRLAVGLALAACSFAVAALGSPMRAQSPQPPSALPRFLDEFAPNNAVALAPFLDDFVADRDVPIAAQAVVFPSAAGPVRAYLARPDRRERLPAVLLVYDEEAWATWMNTNAHELASIGYVALAVQVRRVAAEGTHTDEAALAELSGAVRWLRRQANVVPGRLGVVGWGWSGGQALALASALPLQACVTCDAPLPVDPELFPGLRDTPLLAIFGGADPASEAQRRQLHKHLSRAAIPHRFIVPAKVQAGFMGPLNAKTYAHDAAEDAWVAIYTFLEKHIEDARPANRAPAPITPPTATIADMMRAVNAPAGLRGTLSRALEQQPSTAKEWLQIRAHAALIAEAGGWLRSRRPAKGQPAHWDEQAGAFIAAANAIVEAADRRDHAAAQQGLAHLAAQCSACHAEHR